MASVFAINQNGRDISWYMNFELIKEQRLIQNLVQEFNGANV